MSGVGRYAVAVDFCDVASFQDGQESRPQRNQGLHGRNEKQDRDVVVF